MIIDSKVIPELLKPEAKSLIWENWQEPLHGELCGYCHNCFVVFVGLFYILLLTRIGVVELLCKIW
jgi:hypothetical protein